MILFDTVFELAYYDVIVLHVNPFTKGTPPSCVLSMTQKTYLIVRLLLWRSGEYGVTLHCHYSHFILISICSTC